MIRALITSGPPNLRIITPTISSISFNYSFTSERFPEATERERVSGLKKTTGSRSWPSVVKRLSQNHPPAVEPCAPIGLVLPPRRLMLYKVPNSCEGARQKLFLGSCRGAKYSSGAAVVAIRQSIARNTTTRLSTYSNYRRPGIASPVLLLSRADEIVRVFNSIVVGEERKHIRVPL